MKNCTFPAAWKEATVIGIHKPNKHRSDPSAYRPISLLSSLGKIYERLLLARLHSHIDSRGLLIDEQFGFRAGHSCVQQVHRITEHVLSNMHQRRPIGTAALFFDVAKAFDKVWHSGLIYKLYQLEVPDSLVLILRDYLTDRSFRYRVEGALSSPHPIRAGVPQGSVLSPTLYSLYTNDIPRTPRVKLALFADDTALYYSGRNRCLASKVLQTAATALGEWFRKWRIEVNPEKSTAVYFSRGTLRLNRNNPRKNLIPIQMFGRTIPWTNRVKYLGVLLDKAMTFRPHIRKVRDTAAFVLGRLAPLLSKRSKMSLRHKVTIYKTCIRPIMTYASVTFAHAAASALSPLQTLQNRFMRKAVGAPWYMRNEDIHRDLNLPTLAQYMKSASKRYFDNAPHHPNPLVVQASDYVPVRGVPSRLRRPRHVLLDPDDAITIANSNSNSTDANHSRTARDTTHTISQSHRPRRRRRRRPPRDTRGPSAS